MHCSLSQTINQQLMMPIACVTATAGLSSASECHTRNLGSQAQDVGSPMSQNYQELLHDSSRFMVSALVLLLLGAPAAPCLIGKPVSRQICLHEQQS
jgi:hypothetical protein